MNNVITVKNLSKTFENTSNEKTNAVSDVSFNLVKGETLGLVGESGSGKSTIARLIAGLIPPSSGEIRIYDRNLTIMKNKNALDLYSKIQMVFQNPTDSFDPRRTLGYSIGESLKNRGLAKEEIAKKVEELMGLCGLTGDFARKYPHQVSGGQCQRAAIARALAVEPEILICDEITSALDVTVQQQIMELLDSLRKTKNLSIVFICHNLALVQEFCDRVIVLYDGSIVEEGTPDEIIQTPRAEYTQKLIESIL